MNRPSGAIVALVMLALLVAPRSSSAAPGDLDPSFGGFGSGGKIQDLGFTAAAAILDAQGRLVLAGNDGSTFFVQRRSGLSFTHVESKRIVIDDGQSFAGANAVAIAPDGKVVLAGTVFFSGGRKPDIAVARLNPDLTIDTTLADDGTATSDIDNDVDDALAVAVQSDDKIVVAGAATPHGVVFTNLNWVVERFNENGTLDSAFNGNGKWTYNPSAISDNKALAVALQDDGKILVAGQGSPYQIVRLNGDGSMDDGFGDGGAADAGGLSGNNQGFAVAAGLAVAPDGTIIAAGGTGVERHLANGALDSTFDDDGVAAFSITGLALNRVVLQPDGKIVAAGRLVFSDDVDRFVLLRLDVDGSLDPTFGVNGEVTTVFGTTQTGVSALALQGNGMLLAAGGAQAARYRSDGALDAGGVIQLLFDPDHIGSEATALGVQDDGKLVVAGKVYHNSYDMALARLQPDGNVFGLDPTFGNDSPKTGLTLFGFGKNEAPAAMAFDAGKIVVAGQVDTATQANNLLVGRFDADGTPDPSCAFTGYTSVDFGYGDDGATSAVAVTPDGHLYAAGTVRGPTSDDFGLARLTDACIVDKFGIIAPEDYKLSIDLGGDDALNGLVLEKGSGLPVLAGSSGGKIVLVRVHLDLRDRPGIDPLFGVNGKAILDTGGTAVAAGLASQADGRLIVAGTTTTGGSADFFVARFTIGGQLDPAFGNNGVALAGFSAVGVGAALAVRDDDTIAVAGCTGAGAAGQVAVAQFTASGHLDGRFKGSGKATLKIGDGEQCAQAAAFLGSTRLVVGGYANALGRRQFALASFQTAPPSTTTTTTSPTASTTTTTTLPGPVEICGNCIDDDGNGLTDFEDPACCTQLATAGMIVKRARVARSKAGAKLDLSAALAQSGLADGKTSTQDVFLQMLESGHEVLCAHVPAAALRREKATARFRDPHHAIGGATGVDRLLLHAKRNGSGVLQAGGRRMSLAVPPAGSLRITLGLRDPATGDGSNRCAGTQVQLKADRKGARFP